MPNYIMKKNHLNILFVSVLYNTYILSHVYMDECACAYPTNPYSIHMHKIYM